MLLPIGLAIFAGGITFFVIPLVLQTVQLLWDLYRHPLKVQQLARVSVAVEDLCRQKPAIMRAPEFCPALAVLAEQLRDDAQEAGYPLNDTEVLDALVLGIQDSGTASPSLLLELEGRITRSLR
jgi:hypothetical protein